MNEENVYNWLAVSLAAHRPVLSLEGTADKVRIRPELSRAEVLAASIARQQEELARLESVTDPAEWPEETVVMFKRQFTNPGQTYTYVAVKAPNSSGGAALWYVTGRGNTRFTDAEFRELLAGTDVSDSWVVTEWAPL